MAFIGRLHPVLIHFPIALVIVAVAAETAATATVDHRWRTVAIANVRAGAAFALVAAIAGWSLAQAPGTETTRLLEWHRWLGTFASGLSVAAAVAASRSDGPAVADRWLFRIVLVLAGALVAVTGHLGGVLVWGADFLRP
jgi:uncharacterized membrane protein